MLWWNWGSLWLLADRLPLRVHRVRQQRLQMEGGCPQPVRGVLWTTRPCQREGMQYVVASHFTDCYWLSVLFTFVGLPRSVADVPSFPVLSFPSNPAFCLLEMWSRDCLCRVSLCAAGTLLCWFTDQAPLWQHPLKRWGCLPWAALLSSSAALQFIYSGIGQNGDQQWSNYICIVSTFSLLSLFS